MKKLIGALMSLQIIVHLGLLQVAIPGNTTTFLKTLKGITYFNVFKETARINDYVFGFDKP